ncbi:hypothetical protein [Pedobacter alluvionis]|uniref:Toxic anion resistance protein n=1 Tax=Pedobacter alluvionis TaxID=475253 RepID=A0A497YAP2_9SPHI|nr:hypothetical protein [Pedobacter alluvionis]RLJ80652.1 hypothetical protein BCL90_1443 [Pedobacter alluvionis]TFB31909.1 hypothetical protein E3V97_15165 [Pedobacter alluvionis]
MKTPTKNITAPILERYRKYGVTERKKNELDALTIQVMDAQGNVAQYQSIVNALTTKSNDLQGFLATATNNKTQAYNNKILIDQLVQSAADLQSNSKIAFNEMVEANVQTKFLTAKINTVINKLIYSAEVINKLANVIVRKKALNPLISDELVSMVTIAGADANNAVALTLVALQSAFVAQATEMEAETTIGLEYTQSIGFTEMITGYANADGLASLQQLFYQAYAVAKKNYTLAEKANFTAAKQLNMAKASLNTAQVKLKSLQSGLAAANAAALAS